MIFSGTPAFSNSHSRSLPPSPQHTPVRKQSIGNLNPFSLCPSLLESCYVKPPEQAITENITQIIEQLLQCNQNDNLMDMAKETGIQYYSTIPHEQRTDKINILVCIELYASTVVDLLFTMTSYFEVNGVMFLIHR